MKAKLLLSMLTLGLLSVTAQSPLPRVLENGFYLMPNSKNYVLKSVKADKEALKSVPAHAIDINKRTNKTKAGAVTHQVNFILDFNAETQQVEYICLRNQETELYHWDFGVFDLQNHNTMEIPAGTYDIIVEFDQLDTSLPNEWPLFLMYVIHEQVTIDQDMELNFSADEAKNHIHFQTLTIDGEAVQTNKCYVDESDNWIVLEEGNIDDVEFYSTISCKDYGTVQINLGNYGDRTEGAYINPGDGLLGDFYVNDVSDRFAFYSFRTAHKGSNIFTSASETIGVSEDVTLSNDPSKFQLFEDPFIATNHQSEDVHPGYQFIVRNPVDGNYTCIIHSLDQYLPLPEGETYKFYLSASADDNEAGYVPYIIPYVSVKTIEYGQEDYTPVLKSMPLTIVNEQIIIANNGPFDNSSIGNEFIEEPDALGCDIREQLFWPTNPAFSYPINKKKEILGNNCPLLASRPLQYSITDTWYDDYGNPFPVLNQQMEFNLTYIGRYGEIKDDFGMAQVDIEVDGEDVITADGTFIAQLEELITGVIDATIVKEGIVVDNMAGSNKAKLHYTAGAEDENPPTMTMLHFKDNDGGVTDRFGTADEGKLEFSAGDFNLQITPLQYFATNRQAPESVEVSYSPYGEDNWDELPVEEVPENYWPVMGWFYTGSLAGVTGQGLKGWFDLKIRLTDAAGNWQEQVLSPAFRIDDLAYSSVANVGSSNAHEVARYNLAGQRVDANATGVVIIKMSDGTARKILIP